MWLFRRKRKPCDGPAWEPLPKQASEPLASMVEGRRYLLEHPCTLQKDQLEQDHLNFQHYGVRLLLGGDYAAPLSPAVRHILDVGSGTGKWAYDMAEQFPQAHITGVDLEPPRSPHLQRSKYRFVQADVLRGLPFSANYFDYTHMRFLGVAIPAASWPDVLRQLVRVTCPF